MNPLKQAVLATCLQRSSGDAPSAVPAHDLCVQVHAVLMSSSGLQGPFHVFAYASLNGMAPKHHKIFSATRLKPSGRSLRMKVLRNSGLNSLGPDHAVRRIRLASFDLCCAPEHNKESEGPGLPDEPEACRSAPHILHTTTLSLGATHQCI